MGTKGILTSLIMIGSTVGGAQTGLDRKISFRCEAMPAYRMVVEMSKATGVGFSVSPVVAPEIMVIRAQGVTVRELMARISAASATSWKPEGGSFRLIRTQTQLRNQEQIERNLRVAGFARSIKKKLDDLKKQPEFNLTQAELLARKLQAVAARPNANDRTGNWYNQIQKLEDQGPLVHAITRICALIDPEELADVEPQIKTLYSTAPTPSEKPLDRNVMEIVAQLVADLKTWAEARIKYPMPQNSTVWIGNLAQNRFEDEGGNRPVGKVLLSAFRYTEDSGIQLNLMVVDTKGKFIAESQGNVEWKSYEELAADTPEPKVDPKAPTIEISDQAKVIMKIIGMQTSARASLSESLLNQFLHPEQVEPLSIIASKYLLQVADLKKSNLIALVPDTLFSVYSMGLDKPVTPDQFLHTLHFNFNIEEKDGWLSLIPKYPVVERKHRFDRSALGQILRTRTSGKKLNLLEQASLAVLIPDNQWDNLASTITRVIRPGNQLSIFADPSIMKFYGALTPEVRTAMEGSGISASQLPPMAMDCLRVMLYGQWSGLQYRRPPNEQRLRSAPSRDQEAENEYQQLFWNGIYRETPEVFPNGIPPSAQIKATVTEEDVVIPEDTARQGYTQPGYPMTAGSFAWQKFAQTHLDLFPWMKDSNQQMNLGLLKFCHRIRIDFKFEFSDSLSLQKSLEDAEAKVGEPVPFDQLPENFRAEVAKEMESYAKSYEHSTAPSFNPSDATPVPAAPPR